MSNATAKIIALRPLDRLTFQRGDEDLAKRYIEAGKDINARDQQGWTPLMHAASNGHLSISLLLLSHGADRLASDNTGQAADEIARSKGHIDLASAIQEFGNDHAPIDEDCLDLDIEEVFSGIWLPEEDVQTAPDNEDIRRNIEEVQDSTLKHRPIIRDADWADLKVDLPDSNGLWMFKGLLGHGTQKEFYDILYQAINYGTFLECRVEKLSLEVDGEGDGNFRSHLTQMLEDMGAVPEELDDEWLRLSSEIIIEESHEIEEFLDYLADLSSPVSDPYFHLKKIVESHPLLDRDDEERIARSIRLAMKDAARAISCDIYSTQSLSELVEESRSNSWLAHRLFKSSIDHGAPEPEEADETVGKGAGLEEGAIGHEDDTSSSLARFNLLSNKLSDQKDPALSNDLFEEIEKIGLTMLGVRLVQRRVHASGRVNPKLDECIGQLYRLENEMFMSNVRLAISVAEKYRWSRLDRMDLIQEAFIGLLAAIEKFDFTKGYKFSTYAMWWLKQSVTRAIADKGRIIRLPVHVHEKINKISWATSSFGHNSPFNVPPNDLAASTGYTEDELNKLLPFYEDAFLWNDDDDHSFSVFNALDDSSDPVSAADYEVTKRLIMSSVVKLPGNQPTIIMHRFGLGDCEEKTLEELGEMLGVTRERIRQIESKAIQNLRAPSMGLNGSFPPSYSGQPQ